MSPKVRIGSWKTCEHPDRWLYSPSFDDLGEYTEDYSIKCGWCGISFFSKRAALRQRKERKACR